MKKKYSRWRLTRYVAACAGLVAMIGGLWLGAWRDTQALSFNAGMDAYLGGDFPNAIALFDQSIALYETRMESVNPVERLLLPSPDRALAARAAFQKAMAYAALEEFEEAVDGLEQSLTINPGNDQEALADRRLQEIALVCEYNLEILLRNHPEAGDDANGDGSQSNEHAPGDDPSDQPGEGAGDDY